MASPVLLLAPLGAVVSGYIDDNYAVILGMPTLAQERSVEPDADFRARIINSYGMWGAFCSLVLEASGKRLDELGTHEGLVRLGAEGSNGHTKTN